MIEAGVALAVLWAALFFLPSILAVLGGRRNSLAILVANILLGWTFFGWAIILIWALTKD